MCNKADSNLLSLVVWSITVVFGISAAVFLAIVSGTKGGGRMAMAPQGAKTPASLSRSGKTAAVEGPAVGKKLVQNRGCQGCHQEDSKLVGPSFKEIALRYAAQSGALEMLASRVGQGTQGTWGAIPMPPQSAVANRNEIRSMVQWILSLGPVPVGGASPVNEAQDSLVSNAPDPQSPAPAKVDPVYTEEDILRGQALFQGKERFAKGGTACNACHDVQHDAVIGGGSLAVELTQAFSRLGATGVSAIIGTAPFPIMQQAYLGKELNPDEVHALVAFLRQADKAQLLHQPFDYGFNLFLAGLAGSAILLGVYGLLWRGRKRGSVHQKIYDRQIRSI